MADAWKALENILIHLIQVVMRNNSLTLLHLAHKSLTTPETMIPKRMRVLACIVIHIDNTFANGARVRAGVPEFSFYDLRAIPGTAELSRMV